jgi:hypothetical protein
MKKTIRKTLQLPIAAAPWCPASVRTTCPDLSAWRLGGASNQAGLQATEPCYKSPSRGKPNEISTATASQISGGETLDGH